MQGKYLCDKCDFKTTRAASLKSHKLIKHGLVFQCFYCDKRFAKKDIQKKHLKTCHTSKKVDNVSIRCIEEIKKANVFECVSMDCAFNCDERGIMMEHLKIHTRPLTKNKPQKKIEIFQCDVCDFKTENSCDLQKHASVKHKESPEIT